MHRAPTSWSSPSPAPTSETVNGAGRVGRPRRRRRRSRCCRSTTQLLSDHVGIRDIRDINLTDLLGRNQLDTDVDAIAELPDAASGCWSPAPAARSAPSCAARSTAFAPAELMMLDRDESALHAVQLSIHGRGLLDSDEVILCDIRDADALRGDLRGAPPRGRLPRRRAQAPADARAVPGRGGQDQRARHPQRARGRRARSASTGSSTSPPTRPPTRAACSATPSGSPSGSPPGRAATPSRHLPLGAVRQRAGQPRLGAHRRSPRRSPRAARSRSPTPRSPATS